LHEIAVLIEATPNGYNVTPLTTDEEVGRAIKEAVEAVLSGEGVKLESTDLPVQEMNQETSPGIVKTKVDSLLPIGFFEKYPKAYWNPDLNVYTRLSTNASGNMYEQVFIPQNGSKGPDFLDDLEEGWSNYTRESIIATPDFKPGKSGFRIIFTVSNEHPVAESFSFAPVVRDDEEKLLKIIGQFIPDRPGLTIIAALHSKDTIDLQKAWKRPGANRISDERGVVEFTTTEYLGLLDLETTLVLQTALQTNKYQKYSLSPEGLQWLGPALSIEWMAGTLLNSVMSDRVLYANFMRNSSDPIAAITANFNGQINNLSGYKGLGPISDISLDPNFLKNLGW